MLSNCFLFRTRKRCKYYQNLFCPPTMYRACSSPTLIEHPPTTPQQSLLYQLIPLSDRNLIAPLSFRKPSRTLILVNVPPPCLSSQSQLCFRLFATHLRRRPAVTQLGETGHAARRRLQVPRLRMLRAVRRAEISNLIDHVAVTGDQNRGSARWGGGYSLPRMAVVI